MTGEQHDQPVGLVLALVETTALAYSRRPGKSLGKRIDLGVGEAGIVRVGVLNAASGGSVLIRAMKRFEATCDGATVPLWTTQFNERLGPLRRGEVDLTVTRLPLEQPEIEIGPLFPRAMPSS